MSWLADYFRRTFVRSNGAGIPDRDALNFIGFTVTDNPTTKAIDIVAPEGGGGSATVADDIGKSGPTNIDRVNGLRGRPLSTTAPLVGEKYAFDGTKHVPAGRSFHVGLFADAGARPDADHFGNGYDWADAIEAAIEALDDVNGGRVEFDPTPYGAGYRISRTINVTRSTKLVGHGDQLFFSGTEIVADAGITAFRVWGAGYIGAPNGAPDTTIEGIAVTSLDPSVTLIAPGTTTTGNYVYADTDMTVTDCEDFVNGQNISLEGVGPMNTLAHTLAATTTGSPTVTLSSSGDQVPVVRAGMYIIVGSAFPTPTKVLVRTDLVLTMASNAVTDLVGSPVQYCSPVYARIVSGAASAPGALDGTTSWVIDTTLPIISLNPCEIRHANVAFDLTNIVRFNGVSASHFNGPAFLCRGAAGDTPAKSFNVSSMMNLRSQSCRNAIAIMGADANAGTFQVSALGCFDWNIADFSHLGNTYIGVHTDGGNGIITHDASGNACVFLGCYTEGGTFNSYGPGALILGQAQAIFGGGMSIVKGGIANHWQVGSSSITRHAIVFEPSGNFFRVQSSTGSGSFKLAADSEAEFGTPGFIRWSFDGAFRNHPLVFADSDQSDMKTGSMWFPSGFLLGDGPSKNLDASQAARIASCHSDSTDGGVVVDPVEGAYDAFATAVGTNLPRWQKGDWVRDPELLDGCPTRHVIEGGHRAPGWVASAEAPSFSTICPTVGNHSGSYFTNAGDPGTTDTVEPDWTTAPTLGDTVVDNDITWTNAGDAAYTQPVELDGYIKRAITTSETWSQTDRHFLCGSIEVTGALAGDATITWPVGRFKRWIRNATTGGHNLLFKCATGATVTIANNKGAEIGCNGVETYRRSADVTP